MSLWKTWSDEWDMMVVEEGLTRTWPWWTMHRRRASESLGIEVPNVMERSSGCSIRGIKLVMKNHISLSVNLYWIKKWGNLDTKSGNWSYVWSTPSHILEESMLKQDQIGNIHKVKKKRSDNNKFDANSSWRSCFYVSWV